MTLFGQVVPIFEEDRLPQSFGHLPFKVEEMLRQGVADQSVVEARTATKSRTSSLNGERRKGHTDRDWPDEATVARAHDACVLFRESPLRGHGVAPPSLDAAP